MYVRTWFVRLSSIWSDLAKPLLYCKLIASISMLTFLQFYIQINVKLACCQLIFEVQCHNLNCWMRVKFYLWVVLHRKMRNHQSYNNLSPKDHEYLYHILIHTSSLKDGMEFCTDNLGPQMMKPTGW